MGYVLSILLGIALVGFWVYGLLFGAPWWSWAVLVVGAVLATLIASHRGRV